MKKIYLWIEGIKTKYFGDRHERKEEYITDSDGKVYTKKPVVSRIGIPVGSMAFRVAEREPVPLLMMSVFGGFLGIHRFAVGEVQKGIWYAVSAGGFGILVLLDVLEILGGRFSYLETVYEERDGEILRHRERLYIRRPELRFIWKAGAVLLGTGIAVVLFFTAYKAGYRELFGMLGSFSSQAVRGLLE